MVADLFRARVEQELEDTTIAHAPLVLLITPSPADIFMLPSLLPPYCCHPSRRIYHRSPTMRPPHPHEDSSSPLRVLLFLLFLPEPCYLVALKPTPSVLRQEEVEVWRVVDYTGDLTRKACTPRDTHVQILAWVWGSEGRLPYTKPLNRKCSSSTA